MDKHEFDENLKMLKGEMTVSEIEKAIQTLNECRMKAYEKSAGEKNNITEILRDAYKKEAVFSFKTKRGEEGTLKVLGATLFPTWKYSGFASLIPEKNTDWDDSPKARPWWVMGGFIINEGRVRYAQYKTAEAYIRPIIVIADAKKAGLRPGDDFFINGDSFRLIYDVVAIRTYCFRCPCRHVLRRGRGLNIMEEIGKWYEKLIKENTLLSAS